MPKLMVLRLRQSRGAPACCSARGVRYSLDTSALPAVFREAVETVIARISAITSALDYAGRACADARKGNIFAQYGDEKLQAFLDFVLSEYVKEGVEELDQSKLTPLLELKYRAVSDAARELGGIANIRDTFIGFQKYLYVDMGR